ncbi:Diphthine methyltransferase [Hypsizygus marmoreus]|uniref:methylated diphthine methylhydrolase n=1 Tax=Hypsizygus marmoreus TaxID=39966 RepID=A0A369K7P7_HYPMA|nr:Diphthine methyltransferase [Hypsizygus marmoreus]
MVALDTIFPADAVEFCPHPDAQDIVVCGTYKLDEPAIESTEDPDDDFGGGISSPPQRRRGQCLVYQLDPWNRLTGKGENRGIRQIYSLDLPAVLDMKWCHNTKSANPVLAIADSEGGVTLHEWQTTEKTLRQISAAECASSDTLCLSLDWSDRRTQGSDLGSLVVSLSNGSLCLLSSRDGHDVSPTRSWYAHDYEPWVAAWNYWDTNIIYSGGDDLKWKGWDVRQDCSQPIFTNKGFDAGVTSIQNHPHIEHIIAVGSYDHSVKIFDVRKPLTALTQVDVGGGAWRIKWHPSPSRKGDALIACTHDGVKTLHVDFDSGDFQSVVLKRFDAHESMAYGADWSYEFPRGGETTIGSCSFYDHVFHLWSG